MSDENLRRLSLDLLDNAEVAVVTTIDRQGFPQSRAMFNLRNKAQFPGLIDFFAGRRDGFETWFTTNTASSKMTDLGENRRVSAYFCRAGDWHGLMLGGEMEIVTNPDIKARLWQPGWELYYPLGAADPDYTALFLRPTKVKCYYKLCLATLVG